MCFWILFDKVFSGSLRFDFFSVDSGFLTFKKKQKNSKLLCFVTVVLVFSFEVPLYLFIFISDLFTRKIKNKVRNIKGKWLNNVVTVALPSLAKKMEEQQRRSEQRNGKRETGKGKGEERQSG